MGGLCVGVKERGDIPNRFNCVLIMIIKWGRGEFMHKMCIFEEHCFLLNHSQRTKQKC